MENENGISMKLLFLCVALAVWHIPSKGQAVDTAPPATTSSEPTPGDNNKGAAPTNLPRKQPTVGRPAGSVAGLVPLYPGKKVRFFEDEGMEKEVQQHEIAYPLRALGESTDGVSYRVEIAGNAYWIRKRDVKLSSSVEVESSCLTAKQQVGTAVTRNANEGCLRTP